MNVSFFPSGLFTKLGVIALSLPLLLLVSCGNEGEPADSEGPAEGDTLVVVLPEEPSLTVAEAAPELIGTWQLEEMRVGDTPMSVDEVGESTLTFTAEGEMVSATPELGEETTPFVYQDGLILIDDGFGARRIEQLTNEHLELGVSIDGETVRYRYRRKSE